MSTKTLNQRASTQPREIYLPYVTKVRYLSKKATMLWYQTRKEKDEYKNLKPNKKKGK